MRWRGRDCATPRHCPAIPMLGHTAASSTEKLAGCAFERSYVDKAIAATTPLVHGVFISGVRRLRAPSSANSTSLSNRAVIGHRKTDGHLGRFARNTTVAICDTSSPG